MGYQLYFQSITTKLKAAFSQEKEILLAAEWISAAIAAEAWIYISGTGHSHILAEELFYRAGGFTRVIPILDPALMLHENASQSTEIERIEGYATKILAPYEFKASDVFIICSNSGRNAVPIEMVQIAKSAGVKVIAITNLNHSKSVDSRHSSGLKLYEIADLVIDNYGEIGDASIELKNLHSKVGATSTVIGTALLQAISVQATQILLEKGIQPELFNSANTSKGAMDNELLTEKYKSLIKSL